MPSSPSPVVVLSDDESGDDGAASGALSRSAADRIASTLTTQAAVDALCKNRDVPRKFAARPAGAPPPPQPSPRSTVAKGMDPPARDMTDSMPAEKTAAPAARTGQVKREAHGDTLPLSGKKRRREEVTATDGHDGAAPVSNPRAPPGFDPRSPHSAVPDTLDWKAVQKILEGLVTPSRECHFAASKPSDLLASSYVAVLQAANYATFSTSYALELDEKVLACERDNLALWEQVEKEKAARQAAEAELEKVKAELESAEATAVQQFLGSEEYTRRLAEHALPAYLRGAEEMRRVVLRHYPHVDAGKLELPLD
ncbi:hypothetical protein CFC21_107756 [Triticum aestivum]|uniref:Uncharacterized protein n=2 Tax=Triticum aestivum TaxID=4565 RepID=A0A3B6TLR8_WHEAT|nr:uncharacterized protein LOC123167248 [Triticum aestivum]KAF7107076.1 hypothetical protein CFC21_107756 [Triticum aestivum]